jgi:hypothetical protein
MSERPLAAPYLPEADLLLIAAAKTRRKRLGGIRHLPESGDPRDGKTFKHFA